MNGCTKAVSDEINALLETIARGPNREERTQELLEQPLRGADLVFAN